MNLSDYIARASALSKKIAWKWCRDLPMSHLLSHRAGAPPGDSCAERKRPGMDRTENGAGGRCNQIWMAWAVCKSRDVAWSDMR